MSAIYFVGTYQPIRCGIADYTRFLTQESPLGDWGVLSFELTSRGFSQDKFEENPVWYGIPSCNDLSASMLLNGLTSIGGKAQRSVLWFQHETAIWENTERFVTTLSELSMPKIITFHTLHFQSTDTPEGLRRFEYNLLQTILPHVQAITVFSLGVYNAVVSAFPEHLSKVHLIRHGVHSFPKISNMSRKEAKEKLNDYLLYESDLEMLMKEKLNKARIFCDSDTIVIGQTGFLCPYKQSEALYKVGDRLQNVLPKKRIATVRIGSARDSSQESYAEHMKQKQNGESKFFLETLLPADILPIAQRAFDINFYWPMECTQSGILAHALGAGAIIAGRDLEGVGETLKEAGELVDTEIEQLLTKMNDLILNPEATSKIEENALRYAAKFSWIKQTWQHYELAESLVQEKMLERTLYPKFATSLAGQTLSRNKYNLAPV